MLHQFISSWSSEYIIYYRCMYSYYRHILYCPLSWLRLRLYYTFIKMLLTVLLHLSKTDWEKRFYMCWLGLGVSLLTQSVSKGQTQKRYTTDPNALKIKCSAPRENIPNSVHAAEAITHHRFPDGAHVPRPKNQARIHHVELRSDRSESCRLVYCIRRFG